MKHNPGFLKVCETARQRIQEIDVDTVDAMLKQKNNFRLIDVREEKEWQEGHVPQAIHLSKGILERDIESVIFDKEMPLVLYCGGGSRSALAADSLQNMGYRKVLSMAGGIRRWKEKNLAIVRPFELV